MRRLLLPALLLLAACDDDRASAPVPAPLAMTEEGVGYFCQMTVLDHPGPKAQAHLAGLPGALWFSQVRDAVAFLKSPEKTAEVAVVYVSDMGAAPSWAAPGADNWTDAATAWFVVGGRVTGGMGAPEFAPFAQESAARAFAATHGGVVMRLAEIPAELALAPVDDADAGGDGS
ncbi:MAG: copper resistance protein CopZ [Rhodobacterales bacterium CG_4_10_14_0_8_um_filter_70_9]|nr:MAG: copper resistance protein CopZ [Rhodobacterales bacterium CG_4_10_14_0_8_um_filter_70_9]